jgi:hypothetical protein
VGTSSVAILRIETSESSWRLSGGIFNTAPSGRVNSPPSDAFTTADISGFGVGDNSGGFELLAPDELSPTFKGDGVDDTFEGSERFISSAEKREQEILARMVRVITPLIIVRVDKIVPPIVYQPPNA